MGDFSTVLSKSVTYVVPGGLQLKIRAMNLYLLSFSSLSPKFFMLFFCFSFSVLNNTKKKCFLFLSSSRDDNLRRVFFIILMVDRIVVYFFKKKSIDRIW